MTDNTKNAAADTPINALGFASLSKGMEENFKKVEELMKDFAKTHENLSLDPYNLSKAWTDWLTAVSQNPEKLVEANMALWQHSRQLWQQTALRFMGQEADPVIAEGRGDRRFKHDDWVHQPAFEAIKQS